MLNLLQLRHVAKDPTFPHEHTVRRSRPISLVSSHAYRAQLRWLHQVERGAEDRAIKADEWDIVDGDHGAGWPCREPIQSPFERGNFEALEPEGTSVTLSALGPSISQTLEDLHPL